MRKGIIFGEFSPTVQFNTYCWTKKFCVFAHKLPSYLKKYQTERFVNFCHHLVFDVMVGSLIMCKKNK